MNLFLAIDGGGSRTRCLAIGDNGRILGSGRSGPSNHLLVDREIVRESLKAATREALQGANMSDVRGVAAGLAGVDYDGTGADDMRAVFAEIGFGNVLIEGDMVIAHAGALAGQPGVLALAGTGSSILGIDDEGARIKVGGWGPVFGDEGSAYRIGQAALRAAARDFDGRGPKTMLTAAVTEELDLVDFKGTLEAVYLDGMEPREIAVLSATVDAIAKQGDQVAMGILEKAGAELADSVSAAIRRLRMSNGNIRVSYQGSVMMSCDVVRKSFCSSLSQEFPRVEIATPRFSPVVGAYLLGRAADGLASNDSLLAVLDEARDQD